jgi:hypothetical protein
MVHERRAFGSGWGPHAGPSSRTLPELAPQDDCFLVEAGDGTAEVYLREGEMMANHESGRDHWDLPVAGGRASTAG